MCRRYGRVTLSVTVIAATVRVVMFIRCVCVVMFIRCVRVVGVVPATVPVVMFSRGVRMVGLPLDHGLSAFSLDHGLSVPRPSLQLRVLPRGICMVILICTLRCRRFSRVD